MELESLQNAYRDGIVSEAMLDTIAIRDTTRKERQDRTQHISVAYHLTINYGVAQQRQR